MTRDAAIRNWNDAAARTLKGENHAVDMLLAAGDTLLAALRSRPAPPDDLVALVQRWQKARLALRDAEDHITYGMAEQVWEIHERALLTWVAPAPVAAPAPSTAPQMLNENPVIAAKTRAVMQQIALNNMTTVEQCPGLLAFGPIYRALAAPAPETPAPDAMPAKCSACGASVELCLEYALTALGSTTKCCEQCDHGRRQEAQP